MVPLAIFILIILIDRIVLSEKWPLFDPFRAQWRKWMPRAKRFLKSAPGTNTYLFVLIITTWVLQTSSSNVARQLLLERSTNLHHLVHDPMRVLFGSAFWVTNTGELLFMLLAFTLVASQVERWIGTARTASVFFFGHVGATLLVAFWIWASLNFTIVKSPTTVARDVGASYGLAALAALLTYRAPTPRRWIFIGGIILLLIITLSVDPSFTNWGHAFAFGIGFLSYLFIPRNLRKNSTRASFVP